jgi:hypothetical protein
METRTAGSASGLGKRTSSNAGTAPQADSTERRGVRARISAAMSEAERTLMPR